MGTLRADESPPARFAGGLTTDRMAGVIVLTALLLLVAIRRGFMGALGD